MSEEKGMTNKEIANRLSMKQLDDCLEDGELKEVKDERTGYLISKLRCYFWVTDEITGMLLDLLESDSYTSLESIKTQVAEIENEYETALAAANEEIERLKEIGTRLYFNCDSHEDSSPGMKEWRELTGVHPISWRDDSFELWKARQTPRARRG